MFMGKYGWREPSKVSLNRPHCWPSLSVPMAHPSPIRTFVHGNKSVLLGLKSCKSHILVDLSQRRSLLWRLLQWVFFLLDCYKAAHVLLGCFPRIIGCFSHCFYCLFVLRYVMQFLDFFRLHWFARGWCQYFTRMNPKKIWKTLKKNHVSKTIQTCKHQISKR